MGPLRLVLGVGPQRTEVPPSLLSPPSLLPDPSVPPSSALHIPLGLFSQRASFSSYVPLLSGPELSSPPYIPLPLPAFPNPFQTLLS